MPLRLQFQSRTGSGQVSLLYHSALRQGCECLVWLCAGASCVAMIPISGRGVRCACNALHIVSVVGSQLVCCRYHSRQDKVYALLFSGAQPDDVSLAFFACAMNSDLGSVTEVS